MASYGALIQGPAAFAGVDQGIDFTGKGTVLALGTAQVTRVQRSGSGWPGEGAVLVYRLLDGPARGQFVYVSEDFAPAAGLKPGSIVGKGKPLGQATGSGKAPGIEVGWAGATGLPLAPRPAPRPADQQTPQGHSFDNFVQALGGTGGSDTGGSGVLPVSIPAAGKAAGNTINAVVAAPGQVVGAATSVGDFVGRITDPSYLLRGLQIVAGGTLLLAGLFLLARQVALAADLPDPIKVVGAAVAPEAAATKMAAGPISEQPKRTQRQAGFEPSDAGTRRRPARGAPGSSKLAKGDTIPY